MKANKFSTPIRFDTLSEAVEEQKDIVPAHTITTTEDPSPTTDDTSIKEELLRISASTDKHFKRINADMTNLGSSLTNIQQTLTILLPAKPRHRHTTRLLTITLLFYRSSRILLWHTTNSRISKLPYNLKYHESRLFLPKLK